MIRPCTPADRAAILAVVNAAAEAYRDVIPADRWKAPYMPAAGLDAEIEAGVVFHGHGGYGTDAGLAGVMGIQHVADVTLIRHAYVLPAHQGRGIGSALLAHLRGLTARPLLVGTWAAATWAIRFYERHGFALVPEAERARLLEAYWDVPARQVETSVVLRDATRGRARVARAAPEHASRSG